jgi:pilus assembly protein CpaD
MDAGNSRLVIEVPSGTPNEVASMQAVAEIRALLSEVGFRATDINIEAVQAGGDAQAPIRISYSRYVAEGPECGKWPTNLASSDANLNYPNLGCANQANFAAMVANPADLVTPRGSTSRSGERDHNVWEKYVKGESTISTKSGDEKVQTKGN